MDDGVAADVLYLDFVKAFVSKTRILRPVWKFRPIDSFEKKLKTREQLGGMRKKKTQIVRQCRSNVDFYSTGQGPTVPLNTCQ